MQGLDYIMVGKVGLESLGDDLADGLDQAEQDTNPTVNAQKFGPLVACQKGLDKQCKPRSDCF